MVDLPIKHKKVADAHLNGADLATAYRVGYPHIKKDTVAAANAARLLKNAKVVEYLEQEKQRLADSAIITREEVLRQYIKIAFGDVRKLFNGNGLLRDVKDIDDETAPSIAGVDIDENMSGRGEDREISGYTKKVKMWDKVRALDSIRDMMGWTRGVGSLDNPLQVKIIKDTI